MNKKEYNIAVKEHSHKLYGYLLKLIRDKNEADDLVQDAYMKLWEHCESVEFLKSKAWLFTTARNAMLNKIKKDKRKESMKNLPAHKEPYASDNRYEIKQLLDISLGELPEIQKSIILLRDMEGYNYDEIGEILNLNESQVKVYLFRARKKMKEAVKQSMSYHESN